VQAVLLTVMVMTIALLTVASRVYSSREGAAASSLQAAAQQAAEFGFSEIVAEMNQDSKSYLWVTPFSSWGSVSQAELQASCLYAPGTPSADPIPGVASRESLPGSSELSYQLKAFTPPAPPAIIGSPTPPQDCDQGIFTHRKGGSAEFLVEGTAKRGSGEITTYELKRTVSVGPARSPFQQSLLGDPGVAATAADIRFPSFPPASLPPGPALNCTTDTSDVTGNTYSCSDTSTSTGSPYSFNNASQQKFPYPYVIPDVPPASSPTPFCQDNGTAINCRLASLEVGEEDGSDSVNLIVTAISATSTTPAKPVNLFIDGTLTVFPGAKLCSHASAGASATSVTTCAAASGDWQALRIYGGPNSSDSCPSPPQFINLQAITAPTPSSETGKVNVQNAFLWFPAGSLSVSGFTGSAPLDGSQAALRGRVCALNLPSPPLSAASAERIWPDRIFWPKIYRGYGSRDLSA